MKIWLYDIRPAPNGYIHCHSVNEAIELIKTVKEPIEQLDLDHDLGDYAFDGGDGIKLLDYLAETEQYYLVKLHTMNPVGREKCNDLSIDIGNKLITNDKRGSPYNLWRTSFAWK